MIICVGSLIFTFIGTEVTSFEAYRMTSIGVWEDEGADTCAGTVDGVSNVASKLGLGVITTIMGWSDKSSVRSTCCDVVGDFEAITSTLNDGAESIGSVGTFT